MKITHTYENDTLVICIADELGHHEARRLIDQAEMIIALYPSGKVILDFSGLQFMDSSGLAVVLHIQRALQKTGRSFSVRRTPPQAMRVFQAAGLPRLVRFEGE